jgi:hypothetical protein
MIIYRGRTAAMLAWSVSREMVMAGLRMAITRAPF